MNGMPHVQEKLPSVSLSPEDLSSPSLKDAAFKLRMPEPKAACVLAKLHTAGLPDKTEASFRPHNWDVRQYKHDKTDPTNADRQQCYREKRERERNALRNGEQNGERNGVTPVSAKRPDTDTESEIDDDADASERKPSSPMIGKRDLGLHRAAARHRRPQPLVLASWLGATERRAATPGLRGVTPRFRQRVNVCLRVRIKPRYQKPD
jgi:hypothetical protein